MKLKITPIGNSFGVILPKEALAKLKIRVITVTRCKNQQKRSLSLPLKNEGI